MRAIIGAEFNRVVNESRVIGRAHSLFLFLSKSSSNFLNKWLDNENRFDHFLRRRVFARNQKSHAKRIKRVLILKRIDDGINLNFQNRHDEISQIRDVTLEERIIGSEIFGKHGNGAHLRDVPLLIVRHVAAQILRLHASDSCSVTH